MYLVVELNEGASPFEAPGIYIIPCLDVKQALSSIADDLLKSLEIDVKTGKFISPVAAEERRKDIMDCFKKSFLNSNDDTVTVQYAEAIFHLKHLTDVYDTWEQLGWGKLPSQL